MISLGLSFYNWTRRSLGQMIAKDPFFLDYPLAWFHFLTWGLSPGLHAHTSAEPTSCKLPGSTSWASEHCSCPGPALRGSHLIYCSVATVLKHSVISAQGALRSHFALSSATYVACAATCPLPSSVREANSPRSSRHDLAGSREGG